MPHPHTPPFSPVDRVVTWPAERPLVGLCSGGVGPWSWHHRLAEPTGWRVALEPGEAIELLDALTPACAASVASRRDGWIVAIDFALGGVIEPRAASRHRPVGFPLVSAARVEGEAGPRAEALEPGFEVGAIESAWGRAGYEDAVARAVERIADGDCFQVNLAHAMTGRFTGSAREFFAALVRAARPWFGAYLELPPGRDGRRRVIASASPELFLEADLASGAVLTRPMKGTRRAGSRGELERSEKEAAELAMIVDLMRNDLGRVCRIGSIAVDEPRAIERHGVGRAAIDQGVATVRGVLRAGVGLAGLLRATFPPGSVTGAPKVRAMQIIDELEPEPRGPYCGCLGWIGDDGRIILSVAIRTAIIEGEPGRGQGTFESARVRFPVGAGIVAQSRPDLEWEETLVKASAFMLAAGGGQSPVSVLRP